MAFISKIFKYLKYDRTVRAKSFLLKGNGGFVYWYHDNVEALFDDVKKANLDITRNHRSQKDT